MTANLLDEQLVEPELQATTRAAALRELSALVVRSGLVGPDDTDSLADEVVQREHLESAASGKGLSLQHAEIRQAPSCLVVVGRSRVGVSMAAIDDRPVYLVMLMLSPPEKRARYLEVFGDLVSLFHADDLSERLASAAGPHEIIEVIEEYASSPAQ
jgi:mannitol/fructose-specific phosphotransferase system IIA component (Ntr-type)